MRKLKINKQKFEMLPLLTNQLCYNKLEVELLKLLKLLYIYM